MINILIECDFLGGSGGIEKLVSDMIETLPNNFFVDIFVTIKNENFKINNKNVKIINNLSNIEKYNFFIKIGMNSEALCLNKMPKNCVKILNFAGYLKDNENILNQYDYIWEESPNSFKYRNKYKTITICPPTKTNYKPIIDNEILKSISGPYYVTIANDYDINVKGIDLIYKFAENSEIPLLWFCSDNKNNVINLRSLADTPKNLKIARNIPKNYILDCVSKSKAYICFSRSEGYGHAIAEAVLLNKSVISQNVGIIKYKPDAFNIFNNIEHIKNIKLKPTDYTYFYNMFDNFWNKIVSECVK